MKFTLEMTNISCSNQQAEDLAAAMAACKGLPVQADTDGVRENLIIFAGFRLVLEFCFFNIKLASSIWLYVVRIMPWINLSI